MLLQFPDTIANRNDPIWNIFAQFHKVKLDEEYTLIALRTMET